MSANKSRPNQYSQLVQNMGGGGELSSRKTKAMIFTHRQYKTPQLKLENTDIEIVQNCTFLGMIFDSRLSWKPHIDNINTRCNKRLNVLKCISGSDWGSDTASLLLLFSRSYQTHNWNGMEWNFYFTWPLRKQAACKQATRGPTALSPFRGTRQ